MKKILLITAILLNYFVYSQNTTQDEYNYIKSGILAQMQNGLDVKKDGYTLYDITTIQKDIITFTFKGLERNNDGSSAGIWVHVYHNNSNEYASLCIPFNTPHLIMTYENDVKQSLAPSVIEAYANALAELLTLIVIAADTPE